MTITESMQDQFKQNTKRAPSRNKKLSILHQNVDRISNKIERLNALLDTLDPDVLIVTEHGLKKEILENTRLTGYILTASFSRENYQKGGVAIYTKETLHGRVEIIETQDLSIEMTCEVAALKISLGKTTSYLIGTYRTKHNLLLGLEVISDLLEKIPTANHPVILMGDLNIDCLDKKSDYFQLQDMLISFNMHRLDLPPTRITPTSISSIDSVCTNLQNEELEVQIIEEGLSDHTGQLCSIIWKNDCPTKIPTLECRNLNKKNLLNLKTHLSQQNWMEVYTAGEVNTAYNNLHYILTNALNDTCPLTKFKKRNIRPKIIDPHAINLKTRFLEAQDRYNITDKEEDKRNANQLKKQYDLYLRNQRRQTTTKIISEANDKAKAVWKIINSERKSRIEATSPTELDISGKRTSDLTTMADHFNNYFISVADETLQKSKQPCNQQLSVETENLNTPSLVLHPTNYEEVYRAISSLKPKTSSGYDGISAKLIKTCKEELVNPLVEIINKSYASGIFPTALKLSKVYPKFKQGSTTQASNYRPISLIPTFSKLIEKLTLTRLFHHLSTNGLLPTQQHGFLPGRSTTSALINLTEYIIDQLEDGNTTTAIFLDYSKAFDSLNHDHLMKKLATLGIRGTAHDWFKSYLTGRNQIVEMSYVTNKTIQQAKSKPKRIIRGVPQGSVLGPVLFILYTSDFSRYLNSYSQCIMYADDTVLLLSNENPNQLEVSSNTAFNMAVQYCHQNDLVINEKKTQQLILGRRKDNTGRLPESEDNNVTKYLGILIDDSLSWTPHIDHLCNKLSTGLFVVRRMKRIASTDTAKTAYHALFESHLRYGVTVWGATTKHNLDRLLIIQKRAIRILAELQPRESCRESFKTLNILTVVNLYIMETIIHHHLKSPQSLKTAGQIHHYNTRHGANYCLPIHHRSLTERKPTYAGGKMWNALPQKLKTVGGRRFHEELKNWLLANPFYSTSEFMNRG